MVLVGELNPFIHYAFLACYVAFLLSKPSRAELLGCTAIGVALGLEFEHLHLGPWTSGLGLSVALWALAAPFLRWKTVHPSIALMFVYPFIAPLVMLSLHRNGGIVLDRYLLAADGSFGFQPGFIAAGFLVNHPAANAICDVCYYGLPVALASLLHTVSSRRLVRLCLVLAVTAMVGYAIFPGVGARAEFKGLFPFNPPATDSLFGSLVFQPGRMPRNCMPSLHTSWGMALLIAAWPLGRWWRLGMIVYLLPMLIYTQTDHYLCDIIVAVPWTMAVWSALERRWKNFAMYVTTVTGWLLLIRFGLPMLYASPLIPWTLAAASLAAPALLIPRSDELRSNALAEASAA